MKAKPDEKRRQKRKSKQICKNANVIWFDWYLQPHLNHRSVPISILNLAKIRNRNRHLAMSALRCCVPADAFIVKQILSREWEESEREKRVKERRECLLARAISNVFTLPAKKQKKIPKNFSSFSAFLRFLFFFFFFSLCTLHHPVLAMFAVVVCHLAVAVVLPPSHTPPSLMPWCFFFVSLSVLCAISIRIQVPADLKVNWPSRVLYLLLPLRSSPSTLRDMQVPPNQTLRFKAKLAAYLSKLYSNVLF